MNTTTLGAGGAHPAIAENGWPGELLELQRLSHFRSRAWFRELPLRFIVLPTLDGPVLQFDDWREADASGLRDRIAFLVEGLKRTYEPKRRARAATRIRRYWCALVDLSYGYAFPDAPEIHYAFDAC